MLSFILPYLFWSHLVLSYLILSCLSHLKNTNDAKQTIDQPYKKKEAGKERKKDRNRERKNVSKEERQKESSWVRKKAGQKDRKKERPT